MTSSYEVGIIIIIINYSHGLDEDDEAQKD